MENSNQILQRRASKLRAFVPKAVDRKIEGYNENETEVKLPELVSCFSFNSLGRPIPRPGNLAVFSK